MSVSKEELKKIILQDDFIQWVEPQLNYYFNGERYQWTACSGIAKVCVGDQVTDTVVNWFERKVDGEDEQVGWRIKKFLHEDTIVVKHSMNLKYMGEDIPVSLLNGHVYECVAIETVMGENWYRLIDETGWDYLYQAGDQFEVVEEVPEIGYRKDRIIRYLRYHGPSDPFYFNDGEIYECINIENIEELGEDGKMYRIVDNTGEDYLYPVDDEMFEVIKEVSLDKLFPLL